MKHESYKFYKNFQERTDLTKYGENALLLYALQIKYGIEDIDDVAITSLLDGPDDKKIDLVYISADNNEAVIAQGYLARKDKTEAPANKASDLNTAVSWLLNRELSDLPIGLQSIALELRQKIENDEIKKITLWYVHNLLESKNVEDELKSAEHSLSNSIRTNYKDKRIECHSLEVGLKTIEEWYTALTIPILVIDSIKIRANGYEIKSKEWNCFNTSIPAHTLYKLYKDHGVNLFSANVRDYLGSRKSDSNINNGIKESAEKEANNFYVYNNGITALVNSYSFEKGVLTIKGFSIVNGAQTTGAIGTLKKKPNTNFSIPIRLIKCDNPDTVYEIVKYNNSQNKINAPDFRSGDKVQRRLSKEFDALNVIQYSSRRGGIVDIIKRNPNLLPSVTVGQVLAAFHNEPSVAYNEKSKIWESDKLYSDFFNDHTTAKHIIFIYTLLKAIEGVKLELTKKKGPTKSEEDTLSFLRSRGSIVLLISAIANSIEEFLNRRVTNLFDIQFKDSKMSIEKGSERWQPILNIALSFSNHLKGGLTDGIRNEEKVRGCLDGFKQLISAVKNANSTTIENFSKLVI